MTIFFYINKVEFIFLYQLQPDETSKNQTEVLRRSGRERKPTVAFTQLESSQYKKTVTKIGVFIFVI